MATNEIWDAVIIGGGPAGMMAANQAAKNGARVLIVEKNEGLGKKLLITGGGRCNITNAEFDNRKLLAKFAGSDQFLFSAFSQWSVQNTLNFFHGHGLETKVEAEQRVFPITNKAESVWQVLVNELKTQNVTVRSNATVTGLEKSEIDKSITGIILKNGEVIKAKSVVLATGGKSHPETGSTGDGFKWLKTLGHTIVEPTASLVPLAIRDSWITKLQGVTLPEVNISLLQNGKKQKKIKGKILFTHFGVTGPTILNLSQQVRELLGYDKVFLSLDLVPHLTLENLDTKIQEIVRTEASNKKIKNSLGLLITPATLAEAVLDQAEINADTWSHSLKREERLRLGQTIKNLKMAVQGLLGEDKAIVTAGGVALNEVDFKTMRSRLYDNLYLVGDTLNINRPSGGYSLQLCWTTGFVAGNNIRS